LLDVALDEELGENNYEKVRSKSAFGRVKDDIEQSYGRVKDALDSRFLFKPHGTLSLPATLRPILKEVLNLEEEKLKVLQYVLTDRNIIFIGYSFFDPDIQKIFLPLADQRRLKQVYFVDKYESLLNENEKIKVLLSKGIQPSNFICMESDEFFQNLAFAIEKNKQGRFYPTITRHQIRNSIFDSDKLNCNPSLENRLLVELIIFALKVKGKFSTKALLTCERVKYYTTKLLNVRQLLNGKLPSAYDILKKLESFNILKINEGNKSKVYGIGEESCYLVGQNRKVIIERIIINLPAMLGKVTEGQNKDIMVNMLKKKMERLIKDFDYDLTFVIHPFEFSFQSPNHKKNPIKFRQTLVAKEILNAAAEQNEDCYVIAETGQWLLSNEILASDKLKKVIKIMVSDYRNDPINSLHRTISEKVYKKLQNKFESKNIGLLDWHLKKKRDVGE